MNFDRLAPHYDWMEAVCGEVLQHARTAWLHELAGCRRILSAGEGHGRFASACAARFPDAELVCVEASPAMIAVAQRRLAASASTATIRWQQTELRHWQPDGKFDAIVTCFFLDCFAPAELAQVVARLASAAQPGAVWLVVDFAVPARGAARWRALAVHALMYGFFRFTTGLPARRFTPPDELLRTHGFALAGWREFEWGLLRADLWRRA